jgi:carbon monoxide dehydrogenase subunit G
MRIDRVVGDGFEGGVAGSGKLSIGEVQVGRLKMGISGSGRAQARGRAQQAQYKIAGSGGIDARNVAAETAAVSIAGSGEVTAHATSSAKVDIAGSGDVEILGGGKCTVSKAGSGNVRCG